MPLPDSPETPHRIATVIPSVAARKQMCLETVSSLRALGFDPHVEMSTLEDGAGPRAQGRTAARALRWALDQGAESILYIEDDVLCSRRLPEWVPCLLRLGEVVTFYLPGMEFYPPKMRYALMEYGCFPDEGYFRVVLDHWCGAQGLLLPRDVAEGLVTLSERGIHDMLYGIDVALRRWLFRMNRPLYAVAPNLVQHRQPPSVTAAAFKTHRSILYDER